MSSGSRPVTRTALRKTVLENNDARRKEHQKELAQTLRDEMLLFYKNKQPREEYTGQRNSTIRVSSFKNDTQFPKELANEIYIDRRHNTLFVPLNGLPLPIHISFVKTVSKNDEGKASYVRLNLALPSKEEEENNPDVFFIKEMTFKSRDPLHSQDLVKSINELKKEIAEAEETLQVGPAIKQKELILSSHLSQKARLDEVYLRPAFPGRRYPGELQIHTNGLRYICHVKGEENKLDIAFDNIKHLIFQSCEGEAAVVLHLRVHHSILVGKKRSLDIQFYRDVLDNSVEETSGRKKRINYADEDEMEEELEEQRRKEEADEQFEEFGNQIIETSQEHLLLEIAERDNSFPGIILRQNVSVRNTSESLLFIGDVPSFIVTWSEVEIAYLERVMFGLKNFDIVFINKDHAKEPLHINSVPMTFIDKIKDLLNDNNVPFAESTVNFNWPNIMKMIDEDPVAFYENGGWSSLQADNDSEEEESEEESEFELEESGEEEESEEESEEDPSEEDEEFEESEESESDE